MNKVSKNNKIDTKKLMLNNELPTFAKSWVEPKNFADFKLQKFYLRQGKKILATKIGHAVKPRRIKFFIEKVFKSIGINLYKYEFKIIRKIILIERLFFKNNILM